MNYLFILLISVSFLAQARDSFTFNPDPDTEEFRSLYRSFERGERGLSKGELSKYQIVFVQGLATHMTHRLGTVVGPVISKQDGFLSPFWQQKKFLEKLGIPYIFAPINPNDGCEKNGDVISNTILSAFARNQKKIILITQSKGGPDSLHGLLGNYLAVSKVAGWLAYQPPHLGTYLADAPSEGRLGGKFVDGLFWILKGSGLAIKDMRTDFRRRFMERNAQEIERIVSSFPVVTLVTDENPQYSLKDYLLVPLRGKDRDVAFLAPFVEPIAQNGGGINDGIAMVKGTCIDGGMACVYLHGIDHFAGVMNTSPWKGPRKDERVRTFEALLTMLLNRIK